MENDEAPEGAALAVVPARRRKVYARWSKRLGRRICRRLAAGELLYAICREPGMPTPEAIAKWAREKPDFNTELISARRAGGRPAGTRGPVSSYCPEVGEAIFLRLCEGESLTKLGKDPTLPCLSTLMRWRKVHPEFAELVRLGKEVMAERFCDEGWEMALEATPETAYLTHVRLAQLRWMAGMLAPKSFHTKPVEPDVAREVRTILVRRFGVGIDPETGEKKVVAYCPNPETGEVEREDAPGWRPPGGAMRSPG